MRTMRSISIRLPTGLAATIKARLDTYIANEPLVPGGPFFARKKTKSSATSCEASTPSVSKNESKSGGRPCFTVQSTQIGLIVPPPLLPFGDKIIRNKLFPPARSREQQLSDDRFALYSIAQQIAQGARDSNRSESQEPMSNDDVLTDTEGPSLSPTSPAFPCPNGPWRGETSTSSTDIEIGNLADRLQIELTAKEEYDLDLSCSLWNILDTSFPEGSKRFNLLSTPVSRDLARQCAYIDNERIQVYIAPIIGRKLYFTEQIIDWLRQQGPVIDDAVTTGDRNIGKLLQLDGDDHKAIMEAMLYEILFPTIVNGRIAAWIKAGCREDCEGYEIHDSATHQVVTTTMWVYQQAQSQGKKINATGPLPPINPPPGLPSHPNREQNAGRTNPYPWQSSHLATSATASSSGGWSYEASWRDNTTWQWRSGGW